MKKEMKIGSENENVYLVVKGLDYNCTPTAIKHAVDSAIYGNKSGDCAIHCNGIHVANVFAEEPHGNFTYTINPQAETMPATGWTWDKTLANELRTEFRKLSKSGYRRK